MRKSLLVVGLLVVAGLLVVGGIAAGAALAQGNRTAPYVGRGGMMGGMWGNYDGTTQQYGPGMMQGNNTQNGVCGGTCTGEYGRGFGNNGVCDGTCAATDGEVVITSADQARSAFNDYVSKLNNGNLQVKDVVQFENGYYAVVVEKDTGIGAFELLLSEYTGLVRPQMGPATMWNTKYGNLSRGGMMGRGRYNGTTPSEVTVTAEQARADAQAWIDANAAGATLGTVQQFYGYYSFQYTKDGQVQGLISVNAYNGVTVEQSPLGGCLVD